MAPRRNTESDNTITTCSHIAPRPMIVVRGGTKAHVQDIRTYAHTCVMHACMHACMHAYMHACTHARMHTHIHTCTHTYMCVCVCARAPECGSVFTPGDGRHSSNDSAPPRRRRPPARDRRASTRRANCRASTSTVARPALGPNAAHRRASTSTVARPAIGLTLLTVELEVLVRVDARRARRRAGRC